MNKMFLVSREPNEEELKKYDFPVVFRVVNKDGLCYDGTYTSDGARSILSDTDTRHDVEIKALQESKIDLPEKLSNKTNLLVPGYDNENMYWISLEKVLEGNRVEVNKFISSENVPLNVSEKKPLIFKDNVFNNVGVYNVFFNGIKLPNYGFYQDKSEVKINYLPEIVLSTLLQTNEMNYVTFVFSSK